MSAFENDPEGYRMAQRYAGDNFDVAHAVQIEVMTEYSGEWSVAEFQQMIADSVAQIPAEYRDSALFEMYDPGYDSPVSLRLTYTGPESQETVAARIESCVRHVAEVRAKERAEFQRLKEKFGET